MENSLSYGILVKTVAPVQQFHEHFECNIILSRAISESFKAEPGVWPIISPILFLIPVDWIMKNTITDKTRGIQWIMSLQLEDLDFADDVAMISTTAKQMREKNWWTYKVWKTDRPQHQLSKN